MSVQKKINSLNEEFELTIKTENGEKHKELTVREINSIDGNPLVRCTGNYKEYVIEYDKESNKFLFWNRMSEDRIKRPINSVDILGLSD